VSAGFRHAARPQSIDEDPGAIARCRRLVSALDTHSRTCFEPAHRCLPRGRIALLVDLLPCRSMPHVVDRHVILLSPEERHAGKALMVPEHIAGDSLALALR